MPRTKKTLILEDLSYYEIESLLPKLNPEEKTRAEAYLVQRKKSIEEFAKAFLSCAMVNHARANLIRTGRATRVMTAAGECYDCGDVLTLLEETTRIRNAYNNRMKQKNPKQKTVA